MLVRITSETHNEIKQKKGVFVLWWEDRLLFIFIYFYFSLSLFALTKGIGAQHPHTSVQHSGEDAAAAFSAAALRARVAKGGGWGGGGVGGIIDGVLFIFNPVLV